MRGTFQQFKMFCLLDAPCCPAGNLCPNRAEKFPCGRLFEVWIDGRCK